MPSTPRAATARLDADSGLRALARLVERAVAGLAGPGLAPAFAGASGGAQSGLMQMAIGVSSPRPEQTPTGFPGAGPDAGVDRTINRDIETDHVETWRLVELAQAGDGEAFGQLYDRYVDSVYRFIFYRVNDRALAEDFTSETFLRALRRIGTITYQGRDIGAWFVTIARNIVFDYMKSARHRMEVTTAEIAEGNDQMPSTESAVIEALTSERLMAAIAQLGDEQRECVMLRFIQGFSVSETAAVMNRNDGAIKALQHRAVRKLAELIGGDLDEQG